MVAPTVLVLFRCCEHCKGQSHDLDKHVYPCHDYGHQWGAACQGTHHAATFRDAYSRGELDDEGSLELLYAMISSQAVIV